MASLERPAKDYLPDTSEVSRVLGVGFGVVGLILWLAMIVVTVLVVYWIWVIQDRVSKIAHDLDQVIDRLVARAGKDPAATAGSGTAGPAGGR